MKSVQKGLPIFLVGKSYHQYYSHNWPEDKFAFDHEASNFEGQGQQQGLQWIEFLKVYLYVKFERVNINTTPTINLNASLHLTLKQIELKVNKGCNR